MAIKGVGGYHLACDAEDSSATSALRNRKARGAKPFAVMVADLDVARDIAEVTEDDASLLQLRRAANRGSSGEGRGRSAGTSRPEPTPSVSCCRTRHCIPCSSMPVLRACW